MRGCGQALGEVLKALGYKEAVVALYAGYPFGEYSKDREPTFGAGPANNMDYPRTRWP